MLCPPQVRMASAGRCVGVFHDGVVRRVQAHARVLVGVDPRVACVLQEQRARLLELDAHLGHRDLLGRVHAALDRRHARHLGAQVLHREVVGRLRNAHVGGDSVANMCGKRDAAWSYRPSGISRALSGTNTSLNNSVRLTVPRMPSGSQSPTTLTPGPRRHRQVQRVALRGAGLVERAQHAVVVGRAGQRGEDLLAADDVAAVDLARQRAPGRLAGGRRAAFAEGLRIDLAAFDDVGVVHAAVGLVVGALLGRHVQRVGDEAGPHGRRAHVHVVRQRGGPAVAADLGGHHHVGGEVGAQAAVAARHADLQQAGARRSA
jgi:hypothetical protein